MHRPRDGAGRRWRPCPPTSSLGDRRTTGPWLAEKVADGRKRDAPTVAGRRRLQPSCPPRHVRSGPKSSRHTPCADPCLRAPGADGTRRMPAAQDGRDIRRQATAAGGRGGRDPRPTRTTPGVQAWDCRPHGGSPTGRHPRRRSPQNARHAGGSSQVAGTRRGRTVRNLAGGRGRDPKPTRTTARGPGIGRPHGGSRSGGGRLVHAVFRTAARRPWAGVNLRTRPQILRTATAVRTTPAGDSCSASMPRAAADPAVRTVMPPVWIPACAATASCTPGS